MTIPDNSVLATAIVPSHQQHIDARRNSISSHHQSIGKWFQHKDTSWVKQSSKEKLRTEKAHVHTMVSVARVAAAVVAVAAATSSDIHTSKMAAAMASATELLAPHYVGIAQHAGAHHEQIACAVQSAVGLRLHCEELQQSRECSKRRETMQVFFLMRRAIPGVLISGARRGSC